MADLKELYQDVILDHSRKPRNCEALEHPDRHAEGFNPLCGDRVTVYVRLEDGVVEDIGFQGNGCAISTASASLMTQAVKGRSVAEAQKLFDAFHELVTSDPQREMDEDSVGKLAVLAGVREYPVRVKCATLAWHTLRSALAGESATVKTE
jgi:nitrogen fixation NifU-like protein